MLSLECVCYPLSISSGVRYVRNPHFLKGVWRYLNVDGHEYITSCLFLFVRIYFRWRIGAWIIMVKTLTKSMKKYYLLAVITLFATLTFQAAAYDFSAVAPSGQRLYYNINGTNATVTSQNSSDPYYTTYPTGPLTIPTTVTHNGNTYSVTSIGSFAFGDCYRLTSVTIPGSVTSIGDRAFYYCIGLTSVSIPNSVTSIGDDAFSSSGLTSVTIPNSVISIGDYAFQVCSRLTSVTIPNSVTHIGDDAFFACSGLTSIVVASGNPRYDSRNNCNAIIETATNTLITGCRNTLIPNSVTSIRYDAFYDCSGLTSVTIPNSVTSIGSGAFSYCSGLTSVTIPNAVTFIGDGAFSGCSGLASVTIPNSITSIGNYVFDGCRGLTGSLTIPNSVTSIGNSAFSGCSGLTSVICKGATPPTLGSTSSIPTTATISVPCGTTNAYTLSWGNRYNYQEAFLYEFNVTSSDSTQGTVAVQQQPSCSNVAAIIIAIPSTDHRFVRWNDGDITNPRTVHVRGDTNFVAEFASNGSYLVTTTNCLGAGTYQRGATATVMAAPQVGMRFIGWADGVTTNPRYIRVMSDTTLTPLYAPFGTDTVIMYDTTVVYDTIVNVIHDTTEYNHYFSDTTVVTHHIFDTVRIYDTLTVVNVDTLHHYHYDTVAATRYVFDTVRIYDTLTIVNIDTLHHYHWDTVANTLHHYHYDTTRVFDTIALVSIDTLHHYHYDTTSINHYTFDTVRMYDTLMVFHVDTLYHYHHDTTRVFDTLIVVTFDTLYHYHYDTVANTLHHYHYDTTRVFDTLMVVSVDTLHHYHFDTTRVFDTLMVLNIDTLRHYYYDTTRMYDTLTVVNLDTLHHYYFDTTVSIDTLHHYHYDTTRVTNIVYDTTAVTRYTFDTVWMYDTLIIVNIDTLHHHYYDTMVIRTIYDTTSITHYIYTYDTVYIYDTIYMNSNGIDGAAPANMKVYTTRAEIVVEGTEGMPVQLYDISGRLLERRDEGEDRVKFLAPASGTYVVCIGDRTVRKVVVIL